MHGAALSVAAILEWLDYAHTDLNPELLNRPVTDSGTLSRTHSPKPSRAGSMRTAKSHACETGRSAARQSRVLNIGGGEIGGEVDNQKVECLPLESVASTMFRQK